MLDRTKKHWRLPALKLADVDGAAPEWVQLIRTGTFWHPKYGKFIITRLDLAEIKKNFDEGVRGVDPAIDYAHESDKIAAAWIKDLELRDDGDSLWAESEWTPKGKKVVRDKEYRYLSADLAFKYRDNEDPKKVYGTVLLGAGLTNRPVIKNMEPTTELGEVVSLAEYKGQKMATKTQKALKALEAKLAEAEEQKKALQVRLDEMGDPDEDGDEDEDEDPDFDPKKANLEEMQAAYGKLQKKVAGMSEKLKCMEDDAKKTKGKVEASEKAAEFNKLLSEGKAIEAQREHYLKGDMVKFAEAWKPVKLTTLGDNGKPIEEVGDAQDEIAKKAKVLLSEGKVKTIGEGIRKVMAEAPDLAAKQQKETFFTPPSRVTT